MKFQILAENLKRGVSVVLRGVSTKPQLPILSGILMRVKANKLELVSTDLEVSFWVGLAIKMEEEGEVVVPGKLFSELISSIGVGMIQLSLSGHSLKIESKSVVADVLGQSSDDFPSIPRADKLSLNIDTPVYKLSVERVSVVAAKDDTRPILMGMLWQSKGETVDLVATDGYRLAMDNMEVAKLVDFDKVIIPVRGLMEVSRAIGDFSEGKIGVAIDNDNQQVVFVLGDLEIGTRVIVGEFPPYQQIVPNTYSHRLTCDRTELLEGVRRAKLFAKDTANVIRVKVTNEGVKVEADGSQLGRSESFIEAKVEGIDLTTAFNAMYLLDFLTSIEESEFVWETEGELKPGVFCVEGQKFKQIIMPVRV